MFNSILHFARGSGINWWRYPPLVAVGSNNTRCRSARAVCDSFSSVCTPSGLYLKAWSHVENGKIAQSPVLHAQ